MTYDGLSEPLTVQQEVDILTDVGKSEFLLVEQEAHLKTDNIAPSEDKGSNDINENEVLDKPTHQSLHKQILFDDKSSYIQTLNGYSDRGQGVLKNCIYKRWTAIQPTLKFHGIVYKVEYEKKLFWSTERYVQRTFAIFTFQTSETSSANETSIILVLREPIDVDEVSRLLPRENNSNLILRKGLSFLKNEYFVVEHLIDPMTCKFRLSQLTTPTSIAFDFSAQSKKSFFELITPTGSISMSAIPIQENSKQHESAHYDIMEAIFETTKFEDAISHTLLSAHSLTSVTEDVDISGTHQVVLGTLHSYVVSGNDYMLQNALTNALSMQRSVDVREVTKLDSIDSRDLNLKTPLHYACEKRRPTAISLLVNAGADCTITTADASTPLHLCAARLDDKSISIILSTTYPIRPK